MSSTVVALQHVISLHTPDPGERQDEAYELLHLQALAISPAWMDEIAESAGDHTPEFRSILEELVKSHGPGTYSIIATYEYRYGKEQDTTNGPGEYYGDLYRIGESHVQELTQAETDMWVGCDSPTDDEAQVVLLVTGDGNG